MSQLFESYTFTFYEEEAAVFRPPSKQPPSEWAAEHIVITLGSHQGPWRPDVTPHVVKILDDWALPWVREVDFCAAPQGGGKSTIQRILMLYCGDTTPSDPMMLVLPEKEMCSEVVKDILDPMIDASPRMLPLKSPYKKDNTKYRINLINGAKLYTAWATSAAKLASRSVAKLFFDEVCKYPDVTGKETDPLSLGEVRKRWYPYTYKIFRSSSPTRPEKYWPRFTSAQVVYCYEVRCPYCDEYQLMPFDQIKWPKDVDADQIYADRLAWFVCAECQAKWTDHDRDLALDDARWAPYKWNNDDWDWDPIPEPHRPYHIAFHLPSWGSKLVSLSEVAKDFLKTKDDPIEYAGFVNGHESLPYKDWDSQRDEDHILSLRCELPRYHVPAEAAVLTAYADVQKSPAGFYGVVMGWGWGLSLTGWMINEFFVETWEALQAMFFGEIYLGPDGRPRPINFGLVDSGWNAEQVYAWTRLHPPFYPAKGRQTMDNFWSVKKMDKFPDGRIIPGGLNRYDINTTANKDALALKLNINSDAPGAIHLHADTSQEYARHMCSEYKDEAGVWICPKGKPNHWWDATTGALCAARVIHSMFMVEPKPQPQQPQQPQRAHNSHRPGGRPGWFGR